MATLTTNYPQLNDSNFSNWKFRLECILDEKGVKDIVNKEYTQEDLDQLPEKQKKEILSQDAKARSIIVQCITDRHIEYIKDAKTAFEMLKALRNIFERKSTLSRLYIRRKLLTLQCDENKSLQDHFMKFDALIRDLESTGTKLEEDDKVCHLLLTIPKKYDTVITVLETSSSTLTLDFVKSKLLDVELKLNNSQNSSKTEAECSFNINSGRINVNKCYKCGSSDHFQNKCPKAFHKTDGSNQRSYQNSFRGKSRGNFRGKRWTNNRFQNANVAEQDSEANISFTAYTSTVDNVHEEGKVNFIIDSGATNNLVCSSLEKYMNDVTEIIPVQLKVANGQTMEATRQGKLIVYCNQGDNKVPKQMSIEALIVDGLPFNLFSVQKINKAGFRVTFDNDCAEVTRKNNLLFKCNLENNLFVARFVLGKSNVNTGLSSTSDENLWHLRLGHLNRRGLQLLRLPFSKNPCDSCKKGKATRNVFKQAQRPRSTRVGELIHTDVWGPVDVPTLNGERYYVTITDDFSHFSHVYILKHKSEAESKLIQYVEQQKSQNIKVARLRSDKGGEFMSNNLKKYCLENGVKLEYTAGYTPQQNGVAERLNRTILDKVRSMFVDTNLPKYLWGEAVCCAIYQLNRSPTRALNGKVPAHVYFGKSNNTLDRLRVFGSKVWVYNLPKKGKLEPRATEMRMVGYGGPGYRLWNPVNNKIVVSRDVKFDESDYRYQSDCKVTEPKVLPQLREENEECINSEEISEPVEPQQTQKEANDHQRSKRKRTIPKRYEDYDIYSAYYCLISSENDPLTYKEAVESGSEWQKAIQNELDSHEKFQTWSVADLPDGKVAIDTKWVFRTKKDNVKKARLVAKGYQEPCSSNVYAPVAKMTTVRMTISHALQNDWELRHLDVPTAFLNGTLEDDIYIKIPHGVIAPKGKVLKLNRALYGLKESPRCWNNCFNEFAENNGLKRSLHDVCLYIGEDVWLTLFVDDCLITGKQEKIEDLVSKLRREFNVKDLGNIETFLGTEVMKNGDTISLSQIKMIEKILEKFNMVDCKGKETPMEVNFQVSNDEEVITNVPYREVIGSLNYLAMISRPDISFATSFLGRFLDKPTLTTWKAAKRILQYIKHTKQFTLKFKKQETQECVEGFSDADWGNDITNRKSVTGIAVYHFGNLVSWTSKKQQVVALSTAEAEYLAAAHCATEVIYVGGLAKDFKQEASNPVINVDNQSAIAMMKNYENTKRSKHIDIKAHFIKDLVSKGVVKINYVPSNENVADIFTKALCKEKFIKFSKALGLF